MQSVDFILEGKSYRAWPRSGLNQIAPNARVKLHHEYDARQLLEKIKLYTRDILAELAALCSVKAQDEDAIVAALLRDDLVIGLGVQSGGRAMADPQAGERWRQKQAAPAPVYGAVMQQFLDAQQVGSGGSGDVRLDSIQRGLSAVAESVTGTVAKSAKADTQAWECLIEVAGRNHSPGQSLVLKGQSDKRYPISADRSQPHRSLIAIPVKSGDPVEMELTITAKGPAPIKLPMPDPVRPKQKSATSPALLDNIFIPVRPILYRNLQSDAQRVQLPREGFLYLFWKGQLWRELAVDGQGIPRDIDVAWEREQRSFSVAAGTSQPRKAVGHQLDAIWIPAKWNGEWQSGNNGFELSFFTKQLNWDDIDQLESDPSKREQYCTRLDSVEQYGANQDFNAQDPTLGPLQDAIPITEASTDDNETTTQNQHHKALAPYRANQFAAAYVQPNNKRMVINVADAYASGLTQRTLSEGETVTLKGNKTYSALVKKGRIELDIDKLETTLALELNGNDHPHATDGP